MILNYEAIFLVLICIAVHNLTLSQSSFSKRCLDQFISLPGPHCRTYSGPPDYKGCPTKKIFCDCPRPALSPLPDAQCYHKHHINNDGCAAYKVVCLNDNYSQTQCPEARESYRPGCRSWRVTDERGCEVIKEECSRRYQSIKGGTNAENYDLADNLIRDRLRVLKLNQQRFPKLFNTLLSVLQTPKRKTNPEPQNRSWNPKSYNAPILQYELSKPTSNIHASSQYRPTTVLEPQPIVQQQPVQAQEYRYSQNSVSTKSTPTSIYQYLSPQYETAILTSDRDGFKKAKLYLKPEYNSVILQGSHTKERNPWQFEAPKSRPNPPAILVPELSNPTPQVIDLYEPPEIDHFTPPPQLFNYKVRNNWKPDKNPPPQEHLEFPANSNQFEADFSGQPENWYTKSVNDSINRSIKEPVITSQYPQHTFDDHELFYQNERSPTGQSNLQFLTETRDTEQSYAPAPPPPPQFGPQPQASSLAQSNSDNIQQTKMDSDNSDFFNNADLVFNFGSKNSYDANPKKPYNLQFLEEMQNQNQNVQRQKPWKLQALQEANDKPVIDPGEDGEEMCCFWAANGECDLNPYWMRVHCSHSCGTYKCKLEDALSCPVQLSVQCSTVSKISPEIYGPKECDDISHLCSFWSSIGECWKNATFMRMHCCRSCHKMSRSSRNYDSRTINNRKKRKLKKRRKDNWRFWSNAFLF